ncbi:MAG: hypothetical protein K2I90_11940, partial [Odoribacter sp.]|nr:hypothetical protein [Odoribacter sp.]
LAEGRLEGRAEGRAEGHAEGHAEGLAEGLAEGRAKGKVEGLAEGDRLRKIDSARKMLADGLPTSVIAKYTDLSEEEINGLESL